jgi:hypothetical protein
MRNIQIHPISEVIADVDRQTEEWIANHRHNAAEDKRRIELNYQAAALLDAAGFDLDLPSYASMKHVKVDLGQKPWTKRGKAEFCRRLNLIRRTLDCPLKPDGKCLASSRGRGRWLQVTLRPTEFPGVKVTYQEKLPKGPQVRCKIVRRKYSYKELVCEI